MSYKKYIRRNGKIYGPYVYHSRRVDGKVITEYQGKYKKKKNFFFWTFLFLFCTILFVGFSGTVTEISPENIIKIISAEHLNSWRLFVSDIQGQVKELDGIWSETISDGHYARVTFERKLTNKNDITIYPRIISGNPRVEVYEKGKREKVTEFSSLKENEYNKVYLTNLKGEQDTFDLKVVGGSIQLDYVVDPTFNKRTYNFANYANSSIFWATPPNASVPTTLTLGLGANVSTANYTNVATIDTLNASVSADATNDGPYMRFNLTINEPKSSINWINVTVRGSETAAEVGLISIYNFTLGNWTPFGTLAATNTNITVNYTSVAAINNIISPSKQIILFVKGDSFDAADADALRVDYVEALVGWTNGNPLWSSNSTNGTQAGTFVLHSVNWTDDNALSGYTFEFDNGNGSFFNDTFATFIGTQNWSNVSKTINSTVASTIRWRVYSNDSTNQFNSTSIFSYTTTAANTAPKWFTPSVNDSTPDPNQIVNHQINWTDDTALSWATLEVNSSGTNCNTTANVSSKVITGTTNLTNLSWVVGNACEGKIVSWRMYANDSNNVWNTTDAQTYTVNNVNPTAVFGTNPVNNLNSSTGTITFEIKGSDNLGVSFLRLYSNFSGSWTFNQTNTTPLNNTFWNFTVDGISEGRYRWAVWVNDTSVNGNQDFTDTNRTLTVDLTNPTSTINLPVNNTNTSDNTPTINITMVDNFDPSITYNIYVNDIGNATGSVSNNTATNVTLGQQTDGLKKIIAEATDDSGRKTNSSILFLTIDTIVPQIAFIVPTENNATSKTRTWIFANVSLNETNFKNITYTLQNSTGIVNQTTYTILTTSINWTGLSNSNVKYFYNVTTSDQANNFNLTETREITLTSDQPPIVSILYPQNTTYNVDVTQLNYTATDDISLSHCWYSLDGGATNSTLSVSCSNFTGLTGNQGSNTWTVYANDSTNQVSSASVTFTKDTISPNVQFVAPTTSSGNVSQNFIQANVTATDTNLNNITIRLYNSTGQINSSSTSTSPNFINFTSLPDGIYFYNATANDTFGNINQTETRNITLDTTKPLIQFVAPTENNNTFFNRNWVFANITVTETNENTTTFSIYNSTGLVNSTSSTSGQRTINWTNLAQGIYQYNVTINDSSGNTNLTETRWITLDTTNPLIQFIAPTENNDTNFSRTWILVNVSVTETNFQNITFVLFNTTGLVNSTTYTDSRREINFTSLSDGTYKYNVTTIDKANNQNNTETRFIRLDTGAPTIAYVAPTETNNTFLNRNFIQINVTAGDPNLDKIVIRLFNATGTQINSSTTSTSPNFINFTSLTDGQYKFNATANDTFGNTISLGTENLTIDTIKPSITSIAESPSDPTTYVAGATYRFNATITDTNLDRVIIEFDGTNFTPSSTFGGGIYNFTISNLAAGIHNYYWFANDTAANVNTSTQTYTINNATGNVTLLINNSASNQTAVYGTQTNASASTLFGTVALFRNGTIATSENNVFKTLGVSYYNYTAVSTGDQNHSSASTTLFVTINQAQSDVNLTLNNTRGNVTIVQDSSINLNLSTLTGDSGATLLLYNNGTLINNGTSPLGNLTTFNQIGIFNITGFYLSSQNYTSDFETWYVNVTETPDVTAPSVTSLTEFPSDPATYNPNNIYMFNATITDNRNVHIVKIDFNGTNYTVTNFSGNVYNLTILNLAVGNYTYRWYANDTSGNLNSTMNGSYTINKNTTALSLTITPSTTITYGTETTATGSNCPSQLTCILYRNGTSVSNPETATFGVGTYNYTYNTTGNANYTAYTNTTNLTVNKGIGNVSTYLNNSRSNISINQFTSIYLNGTLQNGVGNIELYNNGTLINNGTSPLSNFTNFTSFGTFNITTRYNGNTNFTSAFETWYVIVSELDITPPNISIVYPQNITYNVNVTQLNYTVVDNQALSLCWYSLDGGATNTTITCGQNVSGLAANQGSNNWKVYANDTRNNLNSSNVTFFVDSINPEIQFVSPTETPGSSIGRNNIQANVSIGDINFDKITIRLYNSTNSLIRQNISSTNPFFINYTSLASGTYYFNASVNDTLNNVNSTETRNVSLVVPTLSIIKPENETYISGTNLPLNFTAINHENVWYNLDNGANTTVTQNVTFNTSQATHILKLFANNSNGLNSTNVTFTVNFTKFIVLYNNYSGASEGNSTEFNQSSFEDIQNLSDVILENTNYGKISFNQNINITDDLNKTDNFATLDVYTDISSNRIEVNSTALPNFNKSATLSLYGLTFTDPRILRDGEVCSSGTCTEQSYSGGTLVFNVTGFTVYSAEETPVSAAAETPSSSSGSSATGGSIVSVAECLQDNQCSEDEICWDFKCAKLFDIKIIDFESPAKLGDFFDFTYFLKGMANINSDVKINFWIEKDGQRVTSGSDTIYIKNFEERTEKTKIFLPSGLDSGIYEFHVQVAHPSYVAESSRTIEISVRGGIATISGFDAGKIRQFVVYSLFIMAMLIVLFVFYLERKKIARSFYRPEMKWFDKYKTSVLVFLLFVIAGAILYLTGMLELLVDALANMFLWIKLNLAQYALAMTIFALFVLMIGLIIILLRKKHFSDSVKDWIRIFRTRRQLNTKYHENVERANPLYKPEVDYFGRFVKKATSAVKEFISEIYLEIKKIAGLIKIKFDSLKATRDSVDSGVKGIDTIGKGLLQEVEDHYIEATGKMKEISGRTENNIGEQIDTSNKISRQGLRRLRNLIDIREKIKNGEKVAEHYVANVLNESKFLIHELSNRIERDVEHGFEFVRDDLKKLKQRASYRFGKHNENARSDVNEILGKTSSGVGSIASSVGDDLNKIGRMASSGMEEYGKNAREIPSSVGRKTSSGLGKLTESLKSGIKNLSRKIKNAFALGAENFDKNLSAINHDVQKAVESVEEVPSAIGRKTSLEVGKLADSFDDGIRDLSRGIKNPLVKEMEALNRDAKNDIRKISNLPGRLVKVRDLEVGGNYSGTRHFVKSFFRRVVGFFSSEARNMRRRNVAQLVNAAKKMETRKTVEELIDEAKGKEENRNKKSGLETY